MRRISILLLLLCSLCATGFAQEKITTDVTRVTFLNPGFSYEKSIGRSQTLYARAFMATSFSFSYSMAFGSDWQLYFDPGASVQYRYYYNYKARQQKEKRTEMNSMNYISPLFETVLSKNRINMDHPLEEKRRAIHTAGLVWGLQRNYEKRFSLDLQLGAGYVFTKVTAQGTDEKIKVNVGNFTTIGAFKLGFWLNKRK